jgi:signal peptidase II
VEGQIVKAKELALIWTAISVGSVYFATKVIISQAASLNGMTIIPGFLDIQFMSNQGVSFGLFAQKSDLGIDLLTGVTAAITVALIIWAYRATRPLLGIALGTIIGGALCNTIGRGLHRGVFDFLVVRVGSIPLFVCNAADVAITLGTLVLLFDQIWETEPFRQT